MFVMGTNRRQSSGDFTVLSTAAVEVTARAVLRAVETATGLGGIPAVGELGNAAP